MKISTMMIILAMHLARKLWDREEMGTGNVIAPFYLLKLNRGVKLGLFSV